METVTKHEIRKRLAYHAKRLRGEMSLSEVARRCGWYPMEVLKIEREETVPGFDKVHQLSEVYGVDINEFLKPTPAGIPAVKRTASKITAKKELR